MAALRKLGIAVGISDLPCEIEGAIRFTADHEHAAYDAEYAQRFWRALLQADRVFKTVSNRFPGQVQPRAFLLGSFDLAVTRFSGRRAPLYRRQGAGLAPGSCRKPTRTR
jgi:hypothetical protein